MDRRAVGYTGAGRHQVEGAASEAVVIGLDYRNFDIHLRPFERGYRVNVFNAPAGDATGEFQQPISDSELAEFPAGLVPGIALDRNLVPNIPAAVSTKAPIELARTLGTRLFNALFDGPVGTCLRRSIDKTNDRDERLRVRLRLSEAPELNRLPWSTCSTQPGTSSFACLTRCPSSAIQIRRILWNPWPWRLRCASWL